jgi:hypothetical protein
MGPVAAVHVAPDANSPILGELQMPTVVTALDTQEFGAWRHIGGAGWDGWVLATQVSPMYTVRGATEAHLAAPRSSSR